MKIKTVLFLFIITQLSFAAIPTIESLFRNASNKEVEADTISINLTIEELTKRENEEDEKQNYKKFVKLLFHKNRYQTIELLQTEYSDISMKNDSLSYFYEGGSIQKYFLTKKGISVEKDLFFGMILTLALNEEKVISNFLKKTNSDYLENKDLLNKDKMLLYNGYKRYLQSVNDEPSLKDELKSPLKPEEPEERQKIKKILASAFYTKQPSVELIKEGQSFYLLAKLEKTTAKFSNDDHKLVEISHHDIGTSFNAKLFDYVLMNGSHEFPKFIIVTISDRKFKITTSSLRHVTYRPATYSKIKSSLRDAMSVQSKTDQSLRPKFLF